MIHYRNGIMHGLCTWRIADYSINGYFNNPNLTLEHESFYLDGEELVIIKKEGSKGTQLSCSQILSPYYNSVLDLWVKWDTENCCFFVGRKVDGKKHGVWILWTKTGDMKKMEYYDMGVILK